jgi:Ni,Fe-hydrogenase maturation factor
VQIVDGGTLGIELTQYVTGTNKLLVIDSINGGAEPGTVFRFHNDAIMEHFQDKLSAHEVGIQDVLALLTVTGHKIPDVIVIGAQPFDVEAGVRPVGRHAGPAAADRGTGTEGPQAVGASRLSGKSPLVTLITPLWPKKR